MGISTRRRTIPASTCFRPGLATLGGIVFSSLYPGRLCPGRVGVELDAIASVVIGGTLLSGRGGDGARHAVWRGDPGLIQTYINF